MVWLIIFLIILLFLLCGGRKKLEMMTCVKGASTKGASTCPLGAEWDGNPKSIVVPSKKKTLPAVKFRRATAKYSTPQKIPRVIYQTHEKDDIPEAMREAMETILSLNQEYDYKYFNSSERRKFIEEHFGERGKKCYDSLKPGAYQADIFRYCVLYIFGGVYLDAGFIELVSLRKILKPDDTFVSATDRYEGRVGCYNAFICSTPKNPILGRVIDICFGRVEKREYGETPLCITGPLALSEAFEIETKQKVNEGDYGNGTRLLEFVSKKGCVSGKILLDGECIFYTKYPSYRVDAMWYTPSAPYYWDMWMKRDIYN